LIELSLSIDNIFVIAIIFSSFKMQKYQHRVLFWGILGAIFFRGLMIFLGVALINKFSWMTYIFGGFNFHRHENAVYQRKDDFDPKDLKSIKSLETIPIKSEINGQKFLFEKTA
jgi:tellurite resistance protein TerC